MTKTTNEFYGDRSHSDGLTSVCKPCKDAANSEWEATHIDLRRAYVGSWAKRNPEKNRANTKAWKQRNPDRARRNNTLWARKASLSKKYGITQAIYDQMVASQKGLCVACGKPPSPVKSRTDDAWQILYVDHDHATGKVRGLLCRKCNILLGWLEKNADRVVALNRYLASLE